MKKLFYILAIVVFCSINLYSQEVISYTTAGLKQNFELSKKRFYITFSKDNEQEVKSSILFKTYEPILDTSAIVTLNEYIDNFEDVVIFLQEQFKNKIHLTDLVLGNEGELELINTNEIIVGAKNIDFLSKINIVKNYEIRQHELIPDVYILKFTETNTLNIFDIVTQLNKNVEVEYAEPNFILLTRPLSIDPLLSNQWAIENNGYMGGVYGADMKVKEAWNYATGLGIKVAVLDDGVQLEHPDLIDNLLPGYDATGLGSMGDCNNNAYNSHGTSCAGIIGATRNYIGVRGVAYNTKIIPVRIAYKQCDSCGWTSNINWIASSFIWAKEHGADVISNSWGWPGGSYNSHYLNSIINDCATNGRNGKGCVLVFATGNQNISSIYYPSSHPKVIAVGASTMCDERKHPSSCGNENWGSNYGQGLSVVAPGTKIYTTNNMSGYRDNFGGTSSACPNVAGVVALILSFNPNFTQNQVRYIIESTADKIQASSYNYLTWGTYPNGTWSHQAGYGRINASSALKKVLNCYYVNKPLDLYIGDSHNDVGQEPNTNAEFPWNSSNIWNRLNNDNYSTHQNPRHHSVYPNYVYVRVKNKGCLPSSINDSLELYWSKFATSASWHYQWDESDTNNELIYPQRGKPIGKLKIPIIQPGQEAIMVFEWYNTLNPIDYAQINSNRWLYSLLARIVAPDDPMVFSENINTYENILNNNNIAYRSLTNLSNGNMSYYQIIDGAVAIDNNFNNTQNFTLTFTPDPTQIEHKIYEHANVYIVLDNVLRTIWINGGKQAYNIIEENDTTLKIIGDNATLGNLNFNAGQTATLTLRVLFWGQYATTNTNFIYHILHKQTYTNKIIGGVAYSIKDTRVNVVEGPILEIIILVDKNDSLNMYAPSYAFWNNEEDNETIYRWYNSDEKLVHEGEYFGIVLDQPKKYKLKVCQEDECGHDIEVYIKFHPNRIETLYGNPATDQVLVKYKINQGEKAYILFTDIYGLNNIINYPLDIYKEELVVDLTGCPIGNYLISLIVDGKIEDTKTLIKQ